MNAPALNLETTIATADADNTLTISTAAPTSIPAGFLPVAWTRRSTTQNPVIDADRYRGILVPDSFLIVPVADCASHFHSLLTASMRDLADARLTSILKESPSVRSVLADSFKLRSLLAWAAEERKRATIDGKQITDWLLASETIKGLSDKSAVTWKTYLPKLAAPTYRQIFKPEQAATILSRIADSDLSHPVVIFLCERLNNIVTTGNEERDF